MNQGSISQVNASFQSNADAIAANCEKLEQRIAGLLAKVDKSWEQPLGGLHCTLDHVAWHVAEVMSMTSDRSIVASFMCKQGVGKLCPFYKQDNV